jgi:hypothetical protein
VRSSRYCTYKLFWWTNPPCEYMCLGCVSTSHLLSTDRSGTFRRTSLSTQPFAALASPEKNGWEEWGRRCPVLHGVYYGLSDLHSASLVTDAGVDMIIAIRLFQAEASTGCEL